MKGHYRCHIAFSRILVGLLQPNQDPLISPSGSDGGRTVERPVKLKSLIHDLSECVYMEIIGLLFYIVCRI